MNTRRLPAEIKKYQNTLRPSREPKDKVKHVELFKLPPAPDWMSRNMKEIYVRDGKRCIMRGTLRDVSLPMFVLYCHHTGLAIDCAEYLKEFTSRLEKKVDREGNLVVRMNGIQRMMFEASKQAKLYAAEFGLTPGSEHRVTSGGLGEDEEDDFIRYMNER